MPAQTRSKSSPSPPANTNGHQFQSGNTTHREEDQWKHRPPYEIHKEDGDFKAIWHGRCHCGKVKYQLSRDKPLDSKYCHCTVCQRLHGAPFQWAAIFHKTDINFTHGHHDLGWYDSSAKSTTHHLPCKVACAYCRTPIMDEGRNMILLFPTLLEEIRTKQGREAFKTKSHMFYNSRVVDFTGDGVQKFAGISNSSDKLNDEGEVLDHWDDEKKKYESELGGKGENGEGGSDSGEKKRKIESDSGGKKKK